MFAALGLALVLMYLILVAQFKSFVDPLAIIISLPLSLIGVVGMLVITGDTLNIMSLIGVILLMGVVAKMQSCCSISRNGRVRQGPIVGRP